jgi:hypothetical protein
MVYGQRKEICYVDVSTYSLGHSIFSIIRFGLVLIGNCVLITIILCFMSTLYSRNHDERTEILGPFLCVL